MYERFTDRSRTIMQLANDEAEASNCKYILSEHILLGLIREEDGVAAHILKNFDIHEDALRHEINRLVETGTHVDPSGDSMPLAKFVEDSMDEARRIGHHYVGSEHMLLALSRDPKCTATIVLANLGLKPAEVRAEILGLLGHGFDG